MYFSFPDRRRYLTFSRPVDNLGPSHPAVPGTGAKPDRSRNAMNTDIARMRNIGISAHIDAGKTTLTERILF